MPRWLQIALHAASLGLGFYMAHTTGDNQYMLGAGVAQTILGAIGADYNPDGSPAAVAYQPPTK